MRVVFVFLFLTVALTAADSYDEVKAKIQKLIDDGFGKDNEESVDRKSVSNDDRTDRKEKRMKSMDWPSDNEFLGSDGDYESFYRSIYGDKQDKKRTSRDDDDDIPSSNSRSRSSDSSPDYSSRNSVQSDSSSNDDFSKNYYKNGKKKGFLGKIIDKVSKKLKSIPGKFAAGAAALSGKVVSRVASIPEKVVDGVSSVSGKVVSGVASIPGKFVDGVKSIPGKAKSVLPGGKKKNGDITLNDYTQDSSKQENHYHVHKDKHYHEEKHRHQDDSTSLKFYNNFDGYGLDKEYGSIYESLRSKRDVEEAVRYTPGPFRPWSGSKLHKKVKPSEKKVTFLF